MLMNDKGNLGEDSGTRASLLGRPAEVCYDSESYCIQRSCLVYIMCYIVSTIVKYYLTKSQKYGIIVVLRRKNATILLSNNHIKNN
jgi:hypothetical protein